MRGTGRARPRHRIPHRTGSQSQTQRRTRDRGPAAGKRQAIAVLQGTGRTAPLRAWIIHRRDSALLNVSKGSVFTYVNRACRKLHAADRKEALAICARYDLL